MAKDTQTYRESEGSPQGRYNNGQIKQAAGQELSPVDGADGYVGSNTGPALGLKIVSGKKGYSTDRPIWSEQSSTMGLKDNAGSEDGDEAGIQGKTWDTSEKASYKKIQTDEGFPQTWPTAKGAGDAGTTESDEPDKEGVFGSVGDGGGEPDTQSVPGSGAGEHTMSDMPQTEFTHLHGGGAPRFKFSGN
jgi:hypothetical protein